MGKSRPRPIWAPKIFIDEIEDIKHEENLFSDNEALASATKHIRIGREMRRIKDLDFGFPPLRRKSKPKKQKDQGGFLDGLC